MTIWVDPPMWPAHGHLWAHLISDTSLAELHAFASQVGIPERSFEGDHYDIPDQRHAEVVAAGAQLTTASDLVRRLHRSGLRFRKRRGERPLARIDDGLAAVGGMHVLEIVASGHEPPASSGAAVVVIRCGESLVLVHSASRPGWAPPGGKRDAGETIRQAAVREVQEETSLHLRAEELRPVGYERIVIQPGHERAPWDAGDNHIAVFSVVLPHRVEVAPQAPDILEATWMTIEQARSASGGEPWWLLIDACWATIS